MQTFRLLILSAVLVAAMVSCSNPNKEWASHPENDRIVHVCGTIEDLSPRDVRIVLTKEAYLDMRNDYYAIRVKGGRFSADVPLNSDRVYELLIPDDKHYHSCRFQVFFADQDTVRFFYDAQDAPELILSPEGNNKEYRDFKEERNNLFADEKKSLEEERLSVGQFYSDEYRTLEGLLNGKTLDMGARDSVIFLQGQMEKDRTAYTPEARQYLQKKDILTKKELDFARDYLAVRAPSLAHFEIVFESMGTASDLDYNYQDWVRFYEQEYSGRFPESNLHQLVGHVIKATHIHKGGHFIDFTLPDKDGQDQTLSQLIKGKYAILEFWATWCGPCILKRHTIKELYSRYKDKDFTVVEVAREFRNDSKWRAFIEKDGADWTDLLAMEENHSVGDAYGLRNAAGGTFLIDKDGVVIKVDPSKEEIEAVLQNL